nr:response regulator [Actinomadura rubrisoli]
MVASGSGIPILMLTAADRIDDKASGFELGADDYLTKPFELRELVLHPQAVRRIRHPRRRRRRPHRHGARHRLPNRPPHGHPHPGSTHE